MYFGVRRLRDESGLKSCKVYFGVPRAGIVRRKCSSGLSTCVIRRGKMKDENGSQGAARPFYTTLGRHVLLRLIDRSLAYQPTEPTNLDC